jgi:hypothetical protein
MTQPISLPILPTSGPIKISDMRTLDNNVVHIKNNETINGNKIFIQNILFD